MSSTVGSGGGRQSDTPLSTPSVFRLPPGLTVPSTAGNKSEDHHKSTKTPPTSQSCLYYACSIATSVDDGSGPVVKMDCSAGPSCPYSSLMHQACYDEFEEEVLKVMRRTGRARSWSEQQRKNNLWLNGYHMVKKICKCMCGQGLLRRDLKFNESEQSDANCEGSLAGNGKSPSIVAMQDPTAVVKAVMASPEPRLERCMHPSCCLTTTSSNEELSAVVRMDCSSEVCPLGNYMHVACCELFEEQILKYMRKTGRARVWTEQRRRNNLWANGYDIVKKVCKCRCGKGYLKRNLQFVPPPQLMLVSADHPSLPSSTEPFELPFNPDDADGCALDPLFMAEYKDEPGDTSDPWKFMTGSEASNVWLEARSSVLNELRETKVQQPVSPQLPVSQKRNPTYGPAWASGLNPNAAGWSQAQTSESSLPLFSNSPDSISRESAGGNIMAYKQWAQPGQDQGLQSQWSEGQSRRASVGEYRRIIGEPDPWSMSGLSSSISSSPPRPSSFSGFAPPNDAVPDSQNRNYLNGAHSWKDLGDVQLMDAPRVDQSYTTSNIPAHFGINSPTP